MGLTQKGTKAPLTQTNFQGGNVFAIYDLTGNGYTLRTMYPKQR